MFIPTTTLTQGGGGGDVTLLHDETLGGAGTFDVSGISGSYAHLKMYLLARASPATNQQSVRVRFNNDSGANYTGQTYSATGGALGAAGDVGAAYIGIGFCPAASSTAGHATGFILEVPGYAGTTWNKLLTAASSTPHGGTFSFLGAAGIWVSTAAITRIEIFLDSGTFVTGSRLMIYGLG